MEQMTPPPAGQPGYPPPAPAPTPAPAPQRSGSDGFFNTIRNIGIARSQDRWVGGVAGGIALRFGVDPLLVRGIFGVTVFFGGAGLILYGLAWALLPEQADGRIHLQETFRGHFDAALLGAIGMFIVGASSGDGWFGWWNNNGFGWISGLLWFAAIATLVALIVAAGNKRGGAPTGPARAQGPWAGAPAPGYPPAGAPGYAGPAGPSTPTPQAAAASGAYVPVTSSYAPPAGYAGPPAGGYAGPPTGYGPPRPPVAYVPPRPPLPSLPPRPLKPRVQGPGAAAIGSVVGLSLVTLAVLLFAERAEGSLNLSVGLTALGVGIVLTGLGIIVAGLRGRKSGTLGFLAIVGTVLAIPAATFTDGMWDDNGNQEVRFTVSDSPWQPSSLAQAREGLAVAVGDVNVDLTELSTAGESVRVPISLGAGDLTVIVPTDTAVSAEIRLAAGDIEWDVDGTQQVSGTSGSRTYDFASDEVTNGASPTLVLQLETGAGKISVVEEDR